MAKISGLLGGNFVSLQALLHGPGRKTHPRITFSRQISRQKRKSYARVTLPGVTLKKIGLKRKQASDELEKCLPWTRIPRRQRFGRASFETERKTARRNGYADMYVYVMLRYAGKNQA